MEFRPCIDIHNGKVKQIIGSTLSDQGNQAADNFVSEKNADYYASLYKKDHLPGGHIILLNKAGSEFYEQTKAQALRALAAFPGGMQIGGGINPDNAPSFLDAGASRVIVTSYVFQNGRILYDHLDALRSSVGREHVVLDLSCRKKDDGYYIVTDRWQKTTEEKLTTDLLERLEPWASEFLVHAADVEGRQHGIEEEVVAILGAYDGLPTTYAGGVRGMEDLEMIRRIGQGRVNVTIGSALDLFGGPLSYEQLKTYFEQSRE